MTYESIFSSKCELSWISNMIWNHWCGGSASFGSTAIFLKQELQIAFFIVVFILCSGKPW